MKDRLAWMGIVLGHSPQAVGWLVAAVALPLALWLAGDAVLSSIRATPLAGLEDAFGPAYAGLAGMLSLGCLLRAHEAYKRTSRRLLRWL